MSKSTAVATQQSAVPALADTPAALGNIDGSDAALPRLKKGEGQSSFVQDGLVPNGSIFVTSGKDDPSPVTVVEDATTDEGVLVHILSVFKNVSWKEGDELRTAPFGDPSAPADARVGYNYVVSLPEVDEDVPVKLLLAASSTGTATRINFHLMKHNGPIHELAFRLKLKKRERERAGQKQRWYVWVEELVEATQENIEIAGRLSAMAAAASARDQQPADATVVEENQPAI